MSLTAEQRLEQFVNDNVLDIARPACATLIESAQRIFNLDYDEILTLSQNEAGASAIVLRQYLIMLQSDLAKLDRIISFCEDNLNYILAREWVNLESGYKFLKTEAKMQWLCINNSFALTCEKVRREAYAKKLDLYILDDIRKIADILARKAGQY